MGAPMVLVPSTAIEVALEKSWASPTLRGAAAKDRPAMRDTVRRRG